MRREVENMGKKIVIGLKDFIKWHYHLIREEVTVIMSQAVPSMP